MSEHKRTSLTIRAKLIAGVLTVIPLVVVWIVLDFVFSVLFAVGSPVAGGFIMFVTDRFPAATPILTNSVLQWLVAIACALLLLYTIGSIASRVIGKKVIELMETLIARIPFVQTVYSGSKKLLLMLHQKPDQSARVVLIDYPHPGLKTVGLVTRVFNDATTGQELAAVYVPTAFNPTAGFMQIVPMSSLLLTSMTMDQAMTMIVSAGAIGPDDLSIAPNKGRISAPRLAARE